jgi:hypothetical protein
MPYIFYGESAKNSHQINKLNTQIDEQIISSNFIYFLESASLDTTEINDITTILGGGSIWTIITTRSVKYSKARMY